MGWKHQFHKAFNYSIILYWTQVDDKVASYYSGTTVLGRNNAGTSIHKGIETEIDGRPFGWLGYRASFTTIDAEWDEGVYGSTGLNLAGKKVNYVPEYEYLVGLDFFPIRNSSFGSITISLDFHGYGQQYEDYANTLERPAANFLDAKIAWAYKGFECYLTCANLTDTEWERSSNSNGTAHESSSFAGYYPSRRSVHRRRRCLPVLTTSAMFNHVKLLHLFWLTAAICLCSAPAVHAGALPVAKPGKINIQAGIDARIIEETPRHILWQLPDGQPGRLTKRPKRVVVLLTSLLELWYETGGTAIARCAGKLNVPAQALALPEVGTFNTPNAEKIIALQPDLVISSNLPAFRRLIPILEENKIEYAYFDYVNFHDYSRILTLFSKLNNTEGQVHRTLEQMAEEISSIQETVTGLPAPKVLTVFTTSNSVSCELSSSQTGVMLSMLGAVNIIPDRFCHSKTHPDKFQPGTDCLPGPGYYPAEHHGGCGRMQTKAQR